MLHRSVGPYMWLSFKQTKWIQPIIAFVCRQWNSTVMLKYTGSRIQWGKCPSIWNKLQQKALKPAFSKTLFHQCVHASYSYPEKNEVSDDFSGELLSFMSQTASSSQLLQDSTLANRSMCPLVLANTNACNHRVFSRQLLKGEHQLWIHSCEWCPELWN